MLEQGGPLGEQLAHDALEVALARSHVRVGLEHEVVLRRDVRPVEIRDLRVQAEVGIAEDEADVHVRILRGDPPGEHHARVVVLLRGEDDLERGRIGLLEEAPEVLLEAFLGALQGLQDREGR